MAIDMRALEDEVFADNPATADDYDEDDLDIMIQTSNENMASMEQSELVYETYKKYSPNAVQAIEDEYASLEGMFIDYIKSDFKLFKALFDNRKKFYDKNKSNSIDKTKLIKVKVYAKKIDLPKLIADTYAMYEKFNKVASKILSKRDEDFSGDNITKTEHASLMKLIKDTVQSQKDIFASKQEVRKMSYDDLVKYVMCDLKYLSDSENLKKLLRINKDFLIKITELENAMRHEVVSYGSTYSSDGSTSGTVTQQSSTQSYKKAALRDNMIREMKASGKLVTKANHKLWNYTKVLYTSIKKFY